MTLSCIEELDERKEKLSRLSLGILKEFKNIIGCEVGVQYGINARDILEKYDIKTLYLVDPYVLYPSVSGEIMGQNSNAIMKLAHEYLKDFEDKIVWIKKFSWKSVDLIPDNLDFIYIDGDHRYKPVLRDLELYYPKVRKGGLFAGHDYDARALGVVKAVNKFFKGKEKLKHGGVWDWWIIKE